MGLFGSKDERKAIKAKAEAGRAKINPLLKMVERANYSGAIHLAALELHDDEVVEFAATGEFEGKGSCLLLTDERVIICGQKGLSVSKHVLNYANVDRVDVGLGLGGASATFFHGSEKTEFEKSAHGPLDDIRTIVQSHQADISTPQAQAVGLQDLERLAQLHARGILTDEEFSAAKNKALGL